MSPLADPTTAPEDPRLLRAVQEYLADIEAGRPPDRAALAARYPDLAEAMGPYLDALEMVHGAGPLLRQPDPPTVPEFTPSEPLGDFRIVREVGRGGMGVVYEAVQLSLGRPVALKVLPFAAALDNRQLQRFKNEARAAALLHHPNVVPVYAVGSERGVHYYAMQLIDGQNIATLIDELRPAPSLTPRGDSTGSYREAFSALGPARSPGDTRSGFGAQLSTQRSGGGADFYRTVARLVAQAAEGLEYAHGVGVVHRDVKPANLLVDGRGNVWVTDFGLAQLQADAGLTQTGDLLGTLRYMSPEQAGGQRALIDHRTDIYSLGATLYELLTLRPIFDGSDRQTLLRQILNDEPALLRTLDRNIPEELEIIVLKAVSKTPVDRYATAQELADDLKRFLEDQPIRARRPSLVEKGSKWARRHKAVVGTALAALLLSVAVLSVATALTVLAWDSERQRAEEAAAERERAEVGFRRADQKAAEANAERARAEESFRQAWQAVDRFVQISEEELAGDPRNEALRQRLLEAALAYYKDFIDQRRDDPSIQGDLEASRDRVQTIIAELTALLVADQYIHLYRPEVQEELKLSQEQREALARLDRNWREGLRDMGRMSQAEREKKRLAAAQEQEAEIPSLLTPAQHKRFKQIARQSRGPLAFSDPDVTQVLRLTAEQKKQVRIIQEQARTFGGPPGMGGDRPGGPGGGMRGMRRDWVDETRRRAMEKIVALLTPEQKRRWDELIGEPFKPRPPSRS